MVGGLIAGVLLTHTVDHWMEMVCLLPLYAMHTHCLSIQIISIRREPGLKAIIC